jgi:hypothetical protein
MLASHADIARVNSWLADAPQFLGTHNHKKSTQGSRTALHKCLPNGRPEAHIDTFGGRTTLKRAYPRIERSRLAKGLGFLTPHPSLFIPASRFLIPASSSPLHASCFPLLASCFTLPAPRYRLFASSRCRFCCRFWMPLLVAVWQSKITARYNMLEEGTASVEGIGEFKLVSHCNMIQVIGQW